MKNMNSFIHIVLLTTQSLAFRRLFTIFLYMSESSTGSWRPHSRFDSYNSLHTRCNWHPPTYHRDHFNLLARIYLLSLRPKLWLHQELSGSQLQPSGTPFHPVLDLQHRLDPPKSTQDTCSTEHLLIDRAYNSASDSTSRTELDLQRTSNNCALQVVIGLLLLFSKKNASSPPTDPADHSWGIHCGDVVWIPVLRRRRWEHWLAEDSCSVERKNLYF